MAVGSFENNVTNAASMDAGRFVVYEIQSKTILDGVKVVSFSESLGSEPSRAVLEARLGTRWNSSGGTYDDQTVESFLSSDGTPFDNYLERDIAILQLETGGFLGIEETYTLKWLGTITNITPSLTPGAESVQMIAQDARWKMQNVVVSGQWVSEKIGNVDYDIRTNAEAVFNENARGNYHNVLLAGWNYGIPYFHSPQGAINSTNVWTLNCAIAYLTQCVMHSQQTGTNPFSPSASSFGVSSPVIRAVSEDNDAVLGSVSVEGMTLNRAISEVCGAALGLPSKGRPFRTALGYTWSVVPMDEWGRDPSTFTYMAQFKFYAIGGDSKTSLPLASRGTAIDPATTRVVAASVNYDISRSVNHVTVLGQHDAYEAEWILRKGWTVAEEDTVTATPDIARRDTPDFILDNGQHDHVFRQWVLDEDGHYSSGTGTSQCTTVFGTLSYHRRVRRFEPPFSLPEAPPRPFLMKVESGGDWYQCSSGVARVMRDRCGITFELNAIDGADDESYIRGKYTTGATTTKLALNTITGVKLTAIVRGDQRAEGARTRDVDAAALHSIEHVEHENQYRNVFRHSSSPYYTGTSGLQTAYTNAGDLDTVAEKMADAAKPMAVSASVVVPWVEFGYSLCTQVEAVGGDGAASRNINLAATRTAIDTKYPRIVSITYDIEGQQTELMLSDVRERRL
jgi:hypothetical protein